MTSAYPLRLSTIDGVASGGWTFANFALNQSTDQHEIIFQAHDAITLARLGVRYGARTGTPPTYKISLQGVNASGHPDGTIKGGGSPASKTFTPPADTTWNGLFKWFTLDNSYVTTRGEWLSLVVAYDSGTVDASNNSSFTYNLGVSGATPAMPYAISNDAGVRTFRNSGYAIFGYGTGSEAYGQPLEAEVNISSVTNPTEYANVFTVPTWSTTYQCVGLRWLGNPPAGSTFTALLYDGGAAGSTTVLQSISVDGDYTANLNRQQITLFDEATLSTLNFGSAYRLSVRPDGATAMSFRGFDVSANGDFNAWPLGVGCYSSTRAGGNWTDTLTRRFLFEPILMDITASGGSGGGPLVGGRLITA